jgi:hypothetical protein
MNFTSNRFYAKEGILEKKTLNLLMILPQEISGYVTEREDEIYTRENLFDYINGAAELYLAYDFSELLVREYIKNSAPTIAVEIYHMSTSEDAFGIFTQETDGEVVDIGHNAIYSKGLLRFWEGKIFTRIFASYEGKDTRAIIMKIGLLIAQSISQVSKKPIMTNLLPSKGLQFQTIRYFHKMVSLNSHYYIADQNIFNLNEDTKAILARYKKGNQKIRLLLIEFPDQNKTMEAYGQFVQIYMGEQPVLNSELQWLKIENSEVISTRKVGRFIITIFEADSPSTCIWLDTAIVEKLKGYNHD